MPYRGSYKLEDCDLRRQWVEQFTSTSLSNVGQWLDPLNLQSQSTEQFSGNIENLIGSAKIPLGVVGPLLIKGEHVNELILCPFATTEGAIVASGTRGANAITRYRRCPNSTITYSSLLKKCSAIEAIIKNIEETYSASGERIDCKKSLNKKSKDIRGSPLLR